ncbi:hypothetical protein EDB19DRAFT_1913061 [Suillus lakei]|nr:hypothetical protein EDB19DRAFT_1913061 [Suillus lakei]
MLNPGDDMLPGLSDHVVEITSSTSRVFDEETTGFQQHTAELLVDVDSDSGVTILEIAGVFDLECDNINGHTFMAAALTGRNLISEKSTLPDLVVHGGFHPINEYDNTDLIPGTYPTLFPFGIGGFEDDARLKF